MAFNKAREEKKWNIWKEKEETELRKYGMSEDAIKVLHEKDWADFNTERRFWEHNTLTPSLMDFQSELMPEPEVLNLSQMIDAIENELLLHTLLQADKKTLRIILLKMMGFSIREISAKTGMNEQTIYTKMNRLKKKIKKFDMCE